MSYLSKIAQFVTDFVRAFQASAEMGQWTPLAQTVREWKATAAVHADPELGEQLASPLNDDFGAVPNPDRRVTWVVAAGPVHPKITQ